MSRLRVKPAATPVTMLLTSARVVPHIARARFDSSFGAIVTAPSAIVAVTSLVTRRLNVPRPPLAVRIWPSSSTATPAGIATGFLPIRDISLSSEHPAQHLAADLGDARFIVRHDPARGRQDRYAQPVIDPRQIGQLGINPPPRLRNARDFADHRLAVDIFQFDLELGDARTNVLLREAPDIALALQDFEDIGAQIRRRRRDDGLARLLPIADAGQHIAERIAHRHGLPPFTSSIWSCRGSARPRPARAPRCATA